MKLQKDNLGKVAITIEKNYWSNKKDYDKLTVVQVEDKFATYISRKPVPAGTALTEREYWIPFSSLREDILIDYNKFLEYYGEELKFLHNNIDRIDAIMTAAEHVISTTNTIKEEIDWLQHRFDEANKPFGVLLLNDEGMIDEDFLYPHLTYIVVSKNSNADKVILDVTYGDKTHYPIDLPVATSTKAGVITAADKRNLDNAHTKVGEHDTKLATHDNSINSLNTKVSANTTAINTNKTAIEAVKESIPGKVKEGITEWVGAAPESLDTLIEIAEKFKEGDDLHTAIVSSIADVKQDVKTLENDTEKHFEKLETVLGEKVTEVEGKGLSTNDFTDKDKETLDSLAYILPNDTGTLVVKNIKYKEFDERGREYTDKVVLEQTELIKQQAGDSYIYRTISHPIEIPAANWDRAGVITTEQFEKLDCGYNVGNALYEATKLYVNGQNVESTNLLDIPIRCIRYVEQNDTTDVSIMLEERIASFEVGSPNMISSYGHRIQETELVIHSATENYAGLMSIADKIVVNNASTIITGINTIIKYSDAGAIRIPTDIDFSEPTYEPEYVQINILDNYIELEHSDDKKTKLELTEAVPDSVGCRLNAATPATAGVMSAADKNKLDLFEPLYAEYLYKLFNPSTSEELSLNENTDISLYTVGTTNKGLGIYDLNVINTGGGSNLYITTSELNYNPQINKIVKTGKRVNIPEVTSKHSGLISVNDKKKLDFINSTYRSETSTNIPLNYANIIIKHDTDTDSPDDVLSFDFNTYIPGTLVNIIFYNIAQSLNAEFQIASDGTWYIEMPFDSVITKVGGYQDRFRQFTVKFTIIDIVDADDPELIAAGCTKKILIIPS